jgi:hypothetical protein
VELTELSTPIGKQDLVRAREVVSTIRNELAPHQRELLDRKLVEAERAFERFNRVASASGRTAEIARGPEGSRAAGRGVSTARGVALIRTASYGLALLILLWPAETAGPEHDRSPEWLGPKMELEDKLRELSLAAQQVQAELELAAATSPGRPEVPQGEVGKRKQETPDWNQKCIDRYVDCKEQKWAGDCYACFRFCQGQHAWPTEDCYPRWEER